jgi:regulator of protease activity HflC (stomatin/prohibitin superfamily)
MNQIKLAIAGMASLLIFVTLLQTYVIIEPGEVGVMITLGKAQESPLTEGLYFKPPFVAKVQRYDVTVQKYQIKASGQSKDLQELTATFAVNFRVDSVEVVKIRREQGTLDNLVGRVITPQTQEAFKIAAARLTAEEAITQRPKLKKDFDEALVKRLSSYGIIVLDTSVVDLRFSTEFANAVERKQIAEQDSQKAVYDAARAEQEAQAMINRAKGEAEAQRLQANALKASGGNLVIQREWVSALASGRVKLPDVLVINGKEGAVPPLLLDLGKYGANK